ncbi:unnamed protein product [Sympodiomycopsis kandeliae]
MTSYTASGIISNTRTGDRVIPQSTRADGSIRKERKVKPGFTPDEDVGKYVPRRLQQQRTGGVPGSSARIGAKSSSSSSVGYLAGSSSSSSSSRSNTPEVKSSSSSSSSNAGSDPWPSLYSVSKTTRNGAQPRNPAPGSSTWRTSTTGRNNTTRSSETVKDDDALSWRRKAPSAKIPVKQSTTPDDWEEDESTPVKAKAESRSTTKTSKSEEEELQDSLAKLSVNENAQEDDKKQKDDAGR